MAVDLLSCTDLYSDLISMGTLCKATGGQLLSIPKFNPAVHSAKLAAEMARCVVRRMWYGALCGKRPQALATVKRG